MASPPTDQRAQVRPIAFALDAGGVLSKPLTLKVRPEDLTRTEPSRLTVHQTLGRETAGWVDNFGEGLPTVTIAGHTGWRATTDNGQDGADAFSDLNNLVTHGYHAQKQRAIDMGLDPANVKLLFIDMLDGFTWNVAPTSFVLRRSKSRPLLFQYNITLQAISTSIDNPFTLVPSLGGIAAGLAGLDGVLSFLGGIAGSVKGWVSAAVTGANSFLAPFANTVHSFVLLTGKIFSIVRDTVGAVKNGFTTVANSLIGIARDFAQIGANVFRTISAIAGLPQDIKHGLMRVAGAFNEAICLFSNSLRARGAYADYDGLYGASNCSSTTGGRSASAYAGVNSFSLMQPIALPVTLSSASITSTAELKRMDPVLTPMPLPDVSRHLDNVVSGTSA